MSQPYVHKLVPSIVSLIDAFNEMFKGKPLAPLDRLWRGDEDAAFEWPAGHHRDRAIRRRHAKACAAAVVNTAAAAVMPKLVGPLSPARILRYPRALPARAQWALKYHLVRLCGSRSRNVPSGAGRPFLPTSATQRGSSLAYPGGNSFT
jgi:hypothetical protein